MRKAGMPLPVILFLFLCGCSVCQIRPVENAPVRYFPMVYPGTAWTTGTYPGSDERSIAYSSLMPAQSSPRTALVYLHGIESHGEWFRGAAQRLAAAGYAVFCLDRRGSGMNREARGFPSGDVERFELLLDDVHAFRQSLGARFDRVHLVGLSWGGKQAVAYALAYPDDFDSLVLITPGLKSRVDLPLHRKIGVLFSGIAAPAARFSLPLKASMFTSDPRYQAMIDADPLRLREATARFLLESRRMDGVIARRIGQLRKPVLLFLAERDPIVDNESVVGLLGHSHAETLLIRRYAGQVHSIQFDAVDALASHMEKWFRMQGNAICEEESKEVQP